ncbi:uncharacterized protein Z519_01360 [Cladophialophora bantiana CBS 173.52]|uniref:Uncharacterized protein n=1 Tax=Cladophialophora bantiana (strain ATCC 10958 / CBS 173.52 / CDC B-1940 / NIH 8579) TaxID=1442370 RepID=A0A0D2F6E9_CLAB1|nr:uncharacterized protein Z519_01360 [Cladophialophora bantiana CBS 173.52]KIW97776.1 hypothetical protein Z519_01360 [Cladophialophora bantiana CBS 173.52]
MTRVSVVHALPVSPNGNDVVEWSFPPGLESGITTLAAWCRVNQQQREHLSSSIEDSDEDLDEATDNGE